MRNIIDTSFQHGKNLEIGNFCVIKEDVVVGDNVKIGDYVLLGPGTVIGDNVFIDSFVRSSGSNRIGNNVILRYGSTIARKVFIEENVFISPNVMTIFSQPDGSKGLGTYLKKGCFIGTAAVLNSNITIGENVVIGAMSYVYKDCLDGKVWTGIPAKKVR